MSRAQAHMVRYAHAQTSGWSAETRQKRRAVTSCICNAHEVSLVLDVWVSSSKMITHALLAQIFRRIPRELRKQTAVSVHMHRLGRAIGFPCARTRRLRTHTGTVSHAVRAFGFECVRRAQAGVVLLQRARHVRVGVGHRNCAVRVSRKGVGLVVDAGDAQAEGGGEARLLRGELELVEHDRLHRRGGVSLAPARVVRRVCAPSGRPDFPRSRTNRRTCAAHTRACEPTCAARARVWFVQQRTCCRIDLMASALGAQVAACLRRQRSLSEARMETTTVRRSGNSGLETLNELASASACSLGSCTAPPVSAMPAPMAAPEAGACSSLMPCWASWSAEMCRAPCRRSERSARGSVRTDMGACACACVVGGVVYPPLRARGLILHARTRTRTRRRTRTSSRCRSRRAPRGLRPILKNVKNRGGINRRAAPPRPTAKTIRTASARRGASRPRARRASPCAARRCPCGTSSTARCA